MTASSAAFAERCAREAQLLAAELAARGARGRALAVVLGSGLDRVVARLAGRVTIPGEELEHLPGAKVAGHAGAIELGDLGGVPVIVQRGRVHLYEGWSPFEVTRAVRAFARLGVRALVLTNAAGGLNRHWEPGTLVRIEDHLDLQFRSPLWRAEAARANPYDRALGAALDRAALRAGIALRRGVYVGLCGPSYETPAEIRALRSLGAQLVGMSTVAESAAACAAGMRVAAISCVANAAAGLGAEPLRHEDVLAAVSASAESVGALLELAASELERVAGDASPP